MNSPAPLRVYLWTWVALMALLAATFASAHFRLGIYNAIINLSISVAKTLLVALFFMHLRRSGPLIVIFAIAALFGLALLFGLSGTDYLTRHTIPAAWESPTTY